MGKISFDIDISLEKRKKKNGEIKGVYGPNNHVNIYNL